MLTSHSVTQQNTNTRGQCKQSAQRNTENEKSCSSFQNTPISFPYHTDLVNRSMQLKRRGIFKVFGQLCQQLQLNVSKMALYFARLPPNTQLDEQLLGVILHSCEKALILEPRIYHISPL